MGKGFFTFGLSTMSNATQHTVDEFVIEMGLQETVMRGLAKLEKQILPVANRLERSLGKPFSKDYSRGMKTTFQNIEKMANASSRNIQNSLSRAFNMGNAGRGLFDSYEREGLAAARNVSRAMRNAYQPVTVPLSGGLNRPRNGSPRLSGSDRISDLAERTRTSAFYGNLALRNPEQHSAYTQRLQALQEQHSATGDLRSFRSDLRALNYEFQQTQRAASIARSTSRMQAMEASSGIRGLMNGLSESVLPLTGAFFSLHKAIEFFQDSIQEGMDRKNAELVFNSAFGHGAEDTATAAMPAKLKVFQIADSLGLDKTQALQDYGRFRASSPDRISDDDLINFQRNESFFARKTGASQDAVSRANTQLLQDMAAGKVSLQNFKLFEEDLPAANKALQKITGVTTGAQGFKDYYKTHGGTIQLFKDLTKAMALNSKETDALTKSLQSEQGRAGSSVQAAKINFFSGFSDGLDHFYKAVEHATRSGLFEKAGHVVGYFIDRIADVIDALSTVADNIDGYLFLAEQYFSNFWNTLTPSTQKHLQELTKYFNDFFDFLLVAGGAALTKKVATGTLKRLGLISAEGAGGAAVGTAAGTVTAASTAAGTAATVAEGAATATGATVAGTAAEGAGVAGAGAAGLAALPLFATGLIGYLASSQKQRDWLKDYDSNRTTTQDYQYGLVPHPSLSAPAQSYNYGQPQTQKVVIQQAPVEFKPVDVNLKLPDGSIQRVALEVVQQQHEVQMMSSQGLGGDWQSAGKNAGWSPSELLTTK